MSQTTNDPAPADKLTESLDALQKQLAEAAASLDKLDADALAGLVKQLQELARTVSDQMTPALAAAGDAMRGRFADALQGIVELAGRAGEQIAALHQQGRQEATGAGGPSSRASERPAGPDTVPAMLAPGEAVLTKDQADASAVPEEGRVRPSGAVQHFAAGTGPGPNPGPPLPSFPSPGPAGALADAAKDLRKQLDGVADAMQRMTADDAGPLEADLEKIADAARTAGPELAKLFAADPKAARSLRDQMQAVIDQAGKMGRAVKDKADSLNESDAKQEDQDKQKKGQEKEQKAHKAARFIESGGGGMSGIVSTVGAAIGPEGEVAAAAINAVTSAISQATDALGGFVASSVEAFNPGVAERYARSVEDLGAVFGQAFTPLMEMATEWTDKLNGVLTSIAPIIGDMVNSVVADLEPVINQVIELFQTMAHSFQDAAKLWGPVFQVITDFIAGAMEVAVAAVDALIDVVDELMRAFLDAMGVGTNFQSFMAQLSETIKVMAQVAKDLIYTLAEMAKQFAKTGKVDVGKAFADAKAKEAAKDKAAKEAGNNKTFAARPAEFAGIEDIGKAAQLKAASQGVGGPAAKPPDENIADIAKAAGFIEDQFISLMARIDRLLKFGEAIVGAVSGKGGAVDTANKGMALEERGLAALSSGGVSEIARALFGG